MKKYVAVLFMSLLIMATGCLGKNDPETPTPEEPVVEETPRVEEVVYERTPAVVIRDCWYAVERGEGEPLDWIAELSQYDKVTYLGISEKRDYDSTSTDSGIDNGECHLIEIEVGDDREEVWVFYNRIVINAGIGVITDEGVEGQNLLYSKDDLAAITGESVEKAQMVIVMKDFSSQDFYKIMVPAISTSEEYYLEKDKISTHEVDISVSKILTTVHGLNADQEVAKRQILNSALDKFSGSVLIDLIVEELNILDNPPPAETDMMEDVPMDEGA